MWGFVTIRGGKPLGEDVGKAVNVQTWGPPVILEVTIPLTDSGMSHTPTHSVMDASQV